MLNNSGLKYSAHCIKRMDQRCISDAEIRLVNLIGESVESDSGAEKFVITKKHIKKIKKILSHNKNKELDLYQILLS